MSRQHSWLFNGNQGRGTAQEPLNIVVAFCYYNFYAFHFHMTAGKMVIGAQLKFYPLLSPQCFTPQVANLYSNVIILIVCMVIHTEECQTPTSFLVCTSHSHAHIAFRWGWPWTENGVLERDINNEEDQYGEMPTCSQYDWLLYTPGASGTGVGVCSLWRSFGVPQDNQEKSECYSDITVLTQSSTDYAYLHVLTSSELYP